MADKTWLGGEYDGNWNTAANWSPAGAPQAGDRVFMTGDVQCQTAPAAPIALLAFDTTGYTVALDEGVIHITTTISIQAGGVLKLGNAAAGAALHRWYGTAKLTGINATFYTISENWGDLGGTVTARFYNSSRQAAGSAAKYSHYYDESRITGGSMPPLDGIYIYGLAASTANICDTDSALELLDTNIYVYGNLWLSIASALSSTSDAYVHLMHSVPVAQPAGCRIEASNVAVDRIFIVAPVQTGAYVLDA